MHLAAMHDRQLPSVRCNERAVSLTETGKKERVMPPIGLAGMARGPYRRIIQEETLIPPDVLPEIRLRDQLAEMIKRSNATMERWKRGER